MELYDQAAQIVAVIVLNVLTSTPAKFWTAPPGNSVRVAYANMLRTLPGQYNLAPNPSAVFQLEPRGQPFTVREQQHGSALREITNLAANFASGSEDDRYFTTRVLARVFSIHDTTVRGPGNRC